MQRRTIIQPKNFFDPESDRELDPTGQPWSHAILAEGKFLFISGQVARGKDGVLVGRGDMLAQTREALKNLEKALDSVGAKLSNVAFTRWFVTSIDDFYKKGASTARRTAWGKDFPTSTLVEIKRLADPEALVEVEAIAVL